MGGHGRRHGGGGGGGKVGNICCIIGYIGLHNPTPWQWWCMCVRTSRLAMVYVKTIQL